MQDIPHNINFVSDPSTSSSNKFVESPDSPTFPNDWVETTLGEVCEVIMGQSPKGESYNLDGNGLPFYQGVTEFDEKYVKIKTFTSEPTKIIEPNTILFSVRAPVGRVNFTKHKSCIGRGNAGLKMYNGNQEFLFHLFKFLEREIQNRTSGTVFTSISGKELKEIPITIPIDSNEQKAIASVLSAFDDKIELLREQNKTLEEIGQAIFKEWFLPSRQAGGKYGVDDLSADKAGELPEGDAVSLPNGWRIGKLGEICEITSGKRPENISEIKTELNQIPLLGATKIMGYVGKYLFDGETLVIGRVGTHGEIQRFNEKIFPSDNTLVLKSDNFIFVYQILKSIDYVKMNRGGVQPLITQTDLKNYEIIIPSDEVLKKFKEGINPIFQKIDQNNYQIQSLARSRDELLPKLMSGKVRVDFI